MFLSRFGIIPRWLARSRRFRHGPVLIVMLVATGSAHAPLQFSGLQAELAITQPTDLIDPATAEAAVTPPAPNTALKSTPAVNPTSVMVGPIPTWEKASLIPPIEFPNLIPNPPLGQTADNAIAGPPTDNSDPQPSPDLPSPATAGNFTGAADVSGGGSGSAASPPQPSTPIVVASVPEPTNLWLLITPFLTLSRIRPGARNPSHQ